VLLSKLFESHYLCLMSDLNTVRFPTDQEHQALEAMTRTADGRVAIFITGSSSTLTSSSNARALT